jgi:CrcB protein
MVNYLQILLVGLGGSLGAIARFKLGGLVLHHWADGKWADWQFPLGTFVVNVLGCIMVGILSGLIERQEWFSPEARIFLMTGILGGFTTFSAFGVETVYLIRRGELPTALLYVSLSLACGLIGVWMGLSVVSHRPFR